MICQLPGESTERELSWLGGSAIRDMSPDGQMLLFEEVLGGRSRLPGIFQRNINGTPAIRLGEGDAHALSPDRRWALAFADESFTLLPTGAGAARVLEKGTVTPLGLGRWLPDGKQIMFAGRESSNVNALPRIYLQGIDGGAPRPITPAGVGARPRIATPDGRAIVGGFGENVPQLYPLDGGSPRPFPALTFRDTPIQWSGDGATIYTVQLPSPPWRTSLDVWSIDVATGRRRVWKTLAPADPVGVDLVDPVVMTPDAKAYCYSYMRRLGSLFTVDGLR